MKLGEQTVQTASNSKFSDCECKHLYPEDENISVCFVMKSLGFDPTSPHFRSPFLTPGPWSSSSPSSVTRSNKQTEKKKKRLKEEPAGNCFRATFSCSLVKSGLLLSLVSC